MTDHLGQSATSDPEHDSYCTDCQKYLSDHEKCDGCGHYACDCICDFLRDEWPTHPANPNRRAEP